MSPPPALLQALAPRFHWIAPLGEGTFGWVGLVEERALGRRAALKLGKQAGNPTQLARFEREAQIAAGLQHPHTVSVHSAGVVHGHPFLVLDYVEGARTLREVERTTGVLGRLAQLRDVARGMAQAHAQGIVHRDLKPDNVLVDPEGVARVTDFGCATGQDVDRLTLSGAAVGTPLYMAPEQLAGERDRVGPPSDVWSLGVMLHEVACGRLPFVADSWTALAGQALSGLAGVHLLPEAPPTLGPVILRCLRADPAQRYPDAGALEAALARALAPGAALPAEGRSGLGLRLGLGALGLALAGALGAWALGAFPAEPAPVDPPPPASGDREPPPRNDARERWQAARGLTDPAAFLAAGEAWLEAFADDPLRDEVEAALIERRLAGPRWVERVGEHPPLISTAAGWVCGYESPSGWYVARGRWDDAPAERLRVRGGGPLGLAGSAASPAFWLLARHQEKGTVLSHVTPEGDSIRLNDLQVSEDPLGFAASRDARSFVVVYPQLWLCYSIEDTGIETRASGGTPPDVDAHTLTFDASAERLLFATRIRQELTTTLIALEVKSLEVVAQLRVPFRVRGLCPLPDGDLLVASNDGTLALHDAEFAPRAYFEKPGLAPRDMLGARVAEAAVQHLVRSPDGLLYVVTEDGVGAQALQVWRLSDRTLIREQPLQGIADQVLSPDGRFLATSTRRGVEVWDRWVPGEWAPR